MENEVEDLKKLVEDLRSELKAAARREELVLNPMGGGGRLKQKLKRTALGRMAMDPNSRVGKVMRSPRTIARIVGHPSILKEMIGEKSKSKNKTRGPEGEEDEQLFAPIGFFQSDYAKLRINVVAEKIDPELMAMAAGIANKENIELRVVTYGEGAAQMQYKKLVDNKKIPKVKNISFYSSVDQRLKNKVFELEVGKNDIFVTRAWGKNGEK